MRTKKNKTIRIDLPSLPGRWADMTWEQLRIIEEVSGNFASEAAYLAHCFIGLERLKPLRYAERWRSMLSRIPLLGHFVAETGRQVADLLEGGGGTGPAMIVWEQCYRFKGFRNALFGRRFFMEDQEVLSFQKRLEFLLDRKEIYMPANPVSRKRIGIRTFRSHFTHLADMSWIHYRLCCMHIQNYTATKDTSHLDKFLSVLYLPEGRISRWMSRITGKTHPDRMSRYFSPLELNVVLIFWNSTQQYYRNSFRHLFNDKAGKKTRDFMKEEAEITVFLSKEIGTVPEKAQNLEAFYALQYLEDNAILQEEKKREIERLKRKR